METLNVLRCHSIIEALLKPYHSYDLSNPTVIKSLLANEHQFTGSISYWTDNIWKVRRIITMQHLASTYYNTSSESVYDVYPAYLAIIVMDSLLSKYKNIPGGNEFDLGDNVLYVLAILREVLEMNESQTFPELPSALLKDLELLNENEKYKAMQPLVKLELKNLEPIVTPLCFLRHFISTLNLPLDSVFPIGAACRILVACLGDIKFCKFSPSDLAACAVFVVAQQAFPSEYEQLRLFIENCQFLGKDNMDECLEMLKKFYKEGMLEPIAADTQLMEFQLSWREQLPRSDISFVEIGGVSCGSTLLALGIRHAQASEVAVDQERVATPTEETSTATNEKASSVRKTSRECCTMC